MIRSLIYSIFVDRFAGPAGQPLAALPEGADPWQTHAGGTLDGILARLDHVAALGADALYLTPIFPARSNHKYDTASFEEVEPRFGGDAAFDRLAAACRTRGLGLVLDGVFNHVSERHAWFLEARADADSPRAKWFRWFRHPDDYARWRGMGWLPELAVDDAALGAHLFDGDDAVLRRWLRRGATGWRLDCANDLGRSICARATRAARLEGAVDGVIGEVMTYAEAWTQSGCLDGVMNYYLRETVIGLCAGEVPVAQAAYNFKRMARAYAPEALLRSWNVLSTHDTPRLATRIADPAARRLARTLAATLPGVPVVYYGDELGLAGGADPDNRRPMPWDETQWDRATLEHVRLLAALRREQRALREGTYLPLPQPGAPSVLAFARVTDRPAEVLVIVANAAAEPTRARVFAPYSFLFDALPLVDLHGAAPEVRMQSGAFDVELPAWGVAVYAVEDGMEGYRFFKER